MNAQIRPNQVPVLTDVVDLSRPAAALPPGRASAPPVVARAPAPGGASRPASLQAPLPLTPLADADVPVEAWLAVAESQITQQVLGDVQRQIDRMFEFRLKETLGPAMERLADQFVEEMRGELASTLRDIVRRAVAQELARLRGR